MVRRGFSLVEVIVAMTLLAIGLLGVSAAGLLSARLLNEAQLREAAVNRANSVLDSVMINGLQGGDLVQVEPYRLEWLASDSAITVTVVLPDGSRLQLDGTR
jgi:prepilin-type N-terminal cleavage/methylation domain-containing protein